jgi:hypothetical protein
MAAETIGPDDFARLNNEQPLVVETIGGVSFDGFREVDGTLWATAHAYTLDDDGVALVTSEERPVVEARFRHDQQRLSRWWNRTHAELMEHCHRLNRDSLDVREVVPTSTAVVAELGPQAIRGRPRLRLEGTLPAWARRGARIVELLDRDAVYCDDDLQFDPAAAAQDGYASLPLIRDDCATWVNGACEYDDATDEPIRPSQSEAEEGTREILARASACAGEAIAAWSDFAARREPEDDGVQRAGSDPPAPVPIRGLLFVPGATELEALAALRFGNFNGCPPTEIHIGIADLWHRRFGARIAGVAFDTLSLVVPRPPSTGDELRRARFELDQLGPDDAPADLRWPRWRLWWD